MKGMRKISRGTGFRGALDYVFEREGGKDKGRLIGGNLSSINPKELAGEFGVVRRLRPGVKKPVWHNSLRLPAGETLTDQQWIEIADSYMNEMGFSELHPRVYVMHDDDAGQHIHIVASRICAAGELYLGQNENLKSTQVIAEIEHKYELTITKGVDRHHEEKEKIVMPASKRLKKNEEERAVRTGGMPPRQRIQRMIDESVIGRPSAVQFAEKLALAGVQVRANIASTGKMNGFSFVIDSVPFSGSQLGDKYKWSALLKRGITFNPATDAAGLEKYKSQLDIKSDAGENEIQGEYSFYLIKFLNRNVKPDGIEYRWKNGAPALFDAGSSVRIIGKSSDAKIKAMLDLAQQKGWKTIRLTGSADFKKRAAIEALRRGFVIENPEMQGFIKLQAGRAGDTEAFTTMPQRNPNDARAPQFVVGKVRRDLDRLIDKTRVSDLKAVRLSTVATEDDDLNQQAESSAIPKI